MSRPDPRLWPEERRAAAYAALMGGTLAEWCASEGVSLIAARASAGRYRAARGLPRHAPLPSELSDAELMADQAIDIARRCGVGAGVVCAERHRRGLYSPKPREVLKEIPPEELFGVSIQALARRYSCSESTVSEARRARGERRPVPVATVPAPRHRNDVKANADAEAREIAAGAPEWIRVGPRFSVRRESAPLDVPTFDLHRDVDPRWEARFLAAEPMKRGTWGESV